MLRTVASLLIALALALGLALALPMAAPALADDGGGSGMSGPPGGPLMPGPSARAAGRTRGCGTGQQRVPAAAIADLPSVTIGIYDGFFLPAQVTVPAGTRVIWVNRGNRPHSTTAWDHWDSGVLMPSQSCEAWFVTPGSYDYLSIVAADGGTMTGNVTVQGSLPGQPATPSTAPAQSPSPGMAPGQPSMPGTTPGEPSMPGMAPGGPAQPGMLPGMPSMIGPGD